MKVHHILSAGALAVISTVTSWASTPDRWGGGNAIGSISDALTFTSGSSDDANEASTYFVPTGLYILRNPGRGGYIQEVSTDNYTFNRSTGLTNTSSGADLTTYFKGKEYLDHIIRIERNESDGSYTLQFLSGNYLNALESNTRLTTGTTGATFTIGTCDGISDNCYFYIRNASPITDGGSEYYYLDGNDYNPVGWNPGSSIPNTVSNNTYLLYPVTLETRSLYDITYTFKEGDNTVYSGKKTLDLTTSPTATLNDAVPALTSDGWTVVSASPELTTVPTSDTEVTLTLTKNDYNDAPVCTSLDEAQSGTGLQIRSGLWLYPYTYEENEYGLKLAQYWQIFPDLLAGCTSYDDVKKTASWALVGNPIEGFEIYNLLTKESVKYANTNGGTKISRVSGANTRFDLKRNGDNWYLAAHGVRTYLNDYQGKLQPAFYANGINDNASKVYFTSLPDITTANLPDVSTLEARVGLANLWGDRSSLNGKTGEELYNALKELGNITPVISTKEHVKQYYIIRNGRTDQSTSRSNGSLQYDDYRYITAANIVCDTNGALQAARNNNDETRYLYRVESDGAVIPMLWSLEDGGSTDGTTYHLRSANVGTLLGSCVQNGNTTEPLQLLPAGTDEQYGGAYALTLVTGAVDRWYIENNNYRLNAWGGLTNYSVYRVQGYNNLTDEGNEWHLLPVNSVTLSIDGTLHWASACYPFAVKLPDGLKAYTARTIGEESITLTEYTEESLPAHTPFVVTNESETATSYTLTIDYDNTATAPTDNLFEGTTARRGTFGEDAVYVLSKSSTDDPTVVFRKNGTVATLPANKAYLPVGSSTQTNALRFDLGQTTAIDTLTTAPAAGDAATTVFYDLRGRRVLYPTRGVYVTGHGEKVFIR
jgi:hypothetical protein